MSRFRPLLPEDESPESTLSLLATYLEFPTHVLLEHIEHAQDRYDMLLAMDVDLTRHIIATKCALILRN